MGRFGGSSPKPTYLYSNAKWLCELDGSKPAVGAERSVTTTRYTDREGRRRCTGTKFLKRTQPVPRYVSNVDAAIQGSLHPHGNSHAHIPSPHLGPTPGHSGRRWPSWLASTWLLQVGRLLQWMIRGRPLRGCARCRRMRTSGMTARWTRCCATCFPTSTTLAGHPFATQIRAWRRPCLGRLRCELCELRELLGLREIRRGRITNAGRPFSGANRLPAGYCMHTYTHIYIQS